MITGCQLIAGKSDQTLVLHGLNVSYNFYLVKVARQRCRDRGKRCLQIKAKTSTSPAPDRPLVHNININYIVPVPEFTDNKILKYVLSGWQMGELSWTHYGMPILVPTSTNQLNTYTFQTASY